MEPDFATLFAPKAASQAAPEQEPDFATLFAPKAPDWRDTEAKSNLEAMQGPKPQDPGTTEVRGNILPFSRNVETGERSLAVPGFIQDPATLPGDVYTGKVNPNSDEGIQRSLGFAGAVTLGGRLGPKPDPIAKPASPALTDVPATSAIKDMQQSMYKEAKDAGVKYSSVGYARAVKDAVMAAKKEGFDPDLHPDSARVLKRLVSEIPKEIKPGALSPMTGVKPTQSYKEFSFEDIDTLRKVVGEALKGVDPNKAKDRRMANIINDKIDEWFENPNPKDVVSGDPQAVARAAGAARKLTVRLKKAEILDGVHQRALDKVGANYTAAGLQTAYRQEFKAIRSRKDFTHRWDKAEQNAIKGIVRGASLENALRYLGKFSPRSPLSAVITMTLGGGLPGGLPLMAMGEVAARTSAKMGQKKVDTLNALVRRGYADDQSLGNP